MNENTYDLPTLVEPELLQPSSLRQSMKVSLIFWRALGKWTALLLALAIASLPWSPGYRIIPLSLISALTLIAAMAAFPAGLAFAMRAIAPQRSRINALLLSSVLLSLVGIGINGFVAPLYWRWAYGQNRVSDLIVRRVALTQIPEEIAKLDSEQHGLRLNERQLERARPMDETARRQVERDQRTVRAKIQMLQSNKSRLVFHRETIYAIGLLPLVATWLGFMSGGWTALIRPGIGRHVFAWGIAMVAAYGSGYALITGYMLQVRYEGSYPYPHVHAVPHVLMLPVMLLIVLAATMYVMKRHLAMDSTR